MNEKMFRRKECAHTDWDMSCWVCGSPARRVLKTPKPIQRRRRLHCAPAEGRRLRLAGRIARKQNKLSCRSRSDAPSSCLMGWYFSLERDGKEKDWWKTPARGDLEEPDKRKMSLWIVLGPTSRQACPAGPVLRVEERRFTATASEEQPDPEGSCQQSQVLKCVQPANRLLPSCRLHTVLASKR